MRLATTNFISKTLRPAKGQDRSIDVIWGVARNVTGSPEEAAAAVREIEKDIELCSGESNRSLSYEARIVNAIAMRKILRSLRIL